MTASLRHVCTALGLSGSTSICRDVFGFGVARVPAAIVATRPLPVLSLTSFVRRLRDRHFHVRLIIAGSELLSSNDQKAIDYAVFRLRDIYAANGIGVGRVTRDLRSAANSVGHASVTTDAALTATGHDLTADGDFVPVVIPASMNISTKNPDGSMTFTLGKSQAPGPCSPRSESGMNSSVVGINGEGTGRTLAHEIGHFLGLQHPATPGTNLMAQTGAVAGDAFNATVILDADRTTARAHCVVRKAISGI